MTGCKINVSQPQQPDVQRQIGLVGSHSAIEEAKRAIWEKVDTVVRSNKLPTTRISTLTISKQQRDQAGGRQDRRGGGGGGNNNNNRNDGGYNNQYSQPQQQSYGQSPVGGAGYGMSQPPMSGMPSMPGMAQSGAPAPAGGDPSADPYAAYGGVQNYYAMWYAAVAAQGGQPVQGQPPAPQ